VVADTPESTAQTTLAADACSIASALLTRDDAPSVLVNVAPMFGLGLFARSLRVRRFG